MSCKSCECKETSISALKPKPNMIDHIEQWAWDVTESRADCDGRLAVSYLLYTLAEFRCLQSKHPQPKMKLTYRCDKCHVECYDVTDLKDHMKYVHPYRSGWWWR